MMSRRSTFPSLSSSRQIMMAWKVSGLSHSPAIIASRPASMRLAIAISPERESSSIDPISRRYKRTGSFGSIGRFRLLDLGWRGVLHLDDLAPFALVLFLGFLALLLLVQLGLLGLDHIDAHLIEHGKNVLDLVGAHLFGGKHGIDLVVGDPPAL